jgi:broad specificity phosphatase PhoE
MPEARLRTLLSELHDELERDGALDDDTKELLREARIEIREALEADAPVAEAAPTARRRLEQAIERFEEEHPDGVALLNRVLEALSHVGI